MNKLETLSTLFNNKILRIPDYQRGYSWETEQLNDLWNDLHNINFAISNSFHFTGIITLNQPNDTNLVKLEEEGFKVNGVSIDLFEQTYYAFNVVDGQQRLVTLLILISLLIDSFEEVTPDDRRKIMEKFISIKKESGTLYLFGYEKDIPSHQYLIGKIFDDDAMKITEPETVYTKNLENTKQFFLLKLNNLDNLKRHNLLKKVINRLLFYVFEIDSDKLDMSLVFETLNYRGKKLSKLELFKNRLIFLVTKRYINKQQLDLRNKIISTWQDIYEWLGKNEKNKLTDDEFLRAFWVMYFKHDDRTEKEFKKFEEDLFNDKYSITNIPENELLTIPQIEKFLLAMSKAIKYWFLINNPTYVIDTSIIQIDSHIINVLTQINTSNIGRFMKILVTAIFFKHNNESGEQTLTLLELIERHNFNVYLLSGKQADTNRVQTMRIINQYFRNDLSYNSLFATLENFTNKYVTFDNINNHIHKNRQRNEKFYDWNGIRYLLWNYEAHLQNKLAYEIDDISKFNLDLIFPYNNSFNQLYPNVVRSRAGKNIEILKFSLGNITFTKRTNQPQAYLQMRSLLKSGSYCDKNIAKFNDWNDANILSNGLSILNFIETRWKITIGNNQEKKKLLIDSLTITIE